MTQPIPERTPVPMLYGTTADDTYYPDVNEPISVASMVKLIKGVVEEGVAVAVVRCSHCGQWGARFCECRKCGAPIE